MDVSGRMGYEEQAELYLRLIRKEVEAWRRLEAFPGPGRPDPFDVMVLLVSSRLETLLKQAARDSGEPYWERLQALDIPIPILVSGSMRDALWCGMRRDDVEAIFTAISEHGWAPSDWSRAALN